MRSLSCSFREHECDWVSDSQKAQDPGSVSSSPSLPSERLVDGSSDVCSNVSTDVGTDQLAKGKQSLPSPIPTSSTTPCTSLDEAHSDTPDTIYVGVCTSVKQLVLKCMYYQ